MVLLITPLLSKAQELSVFSSIYQIKNSTTKTKSEFIGRNIELKTINFGFGSYLDFKNWTLYNEFVISNTKTLSNSFTEEDILLQESIIPNLTTLTTKLGIGKRLTATKKIQVRFLSYLGYRYIDRRIESMDLFYSSITNKLGTRMVYEIPPSHTLELGIKSCFEYACTKNLYLGVGLDFNVQVEKQKGEVKDEVYNYGNSQNTTGYSNLETTMNSTSFHTNFLNVSMVLSYQIWKK